MVSKLIVPPTHPPASSKQAREGGSNVVSADSRRGDPPAAIMIERREGQSQRARRHDGETKLDGGGWGCYTGGRRSKGV